MVLEEPVLFLCWFGPGYVRGLRMGFHGTRGTLGISKEERALVLSYSA